jgi:hypothetical protein
VAIGDSYPSATAGEATDAAPLDLFFAAFFVVPLPVILFAAFFVPFAAFFVPCFVPFLLPPFLVDFLAALADFFAPPRPWDFDALFFVAFPPPLRAPLDFLLPFLAAIWFAPLVCFEFGST